MHREEEGPRTFRVCRETLLQPFGTNLGMVVNTCSSSTQEVESGWQLPEGRSALHSQTQMLKNKTKTRNNFNLF